MYIYLEHEKKKIIIQKWVCWRKSTEFVCNYFQTLRHLSHLFIISFFEAPGHAFLQILCYIRSNVCSQKVPDQRWIIMDHSEYTYFLNIFYSTWNISWWAHHQGRWGTSRSSRQCPSSWPGARSGTGGLTSGSQGHRWGRAETSSGTWTQGAHSRHWPQPINHNISCQVILSKKKSFTLSNNSPLNWNPFPGLTCFRALTISCPPEFSWWPN